MLRRRIVTVLVWVCIGCTGDGGGVASAKRRARPAVAAEAPAPFRELAGVWRGETEVDGWGTVRLRARVRANGMFTATVTTGAHVLQEVGRIRAWDGARLTVAVAGRQETVPAQLEGERLMATVPVVGDVELRRTKR